MDTTEKIIGGLGSIASLISLIVWFLDDLEWYIMAIIILVSVMVYSVIGLIRGKIELHKLKSQHQTNIQVIENKLNESEDKRQKLSSQFLEKQKVIKRYEESVAVTKNLLAVSILHSKESKLESLNKAISQQFDSIEEG